MAFFLLLRGQKIPIARVSNGHWLKIIELDLFDLQLREWDSNASNTALRVVCWAALKKAENVAIISDDDV